MVKKDGGTKKRVKPLTPLEWRIMSAVWDNTDDRRGPAIREIQEAVNAATKGHHYAYTTIQTIIYRLEQKGAVERQKKIGNAYTFGPRLTPRDAQNALIKQAIEAFGGAPAALVKAMLELGYLSETDLSEVIKSKTS